MYFEVLLQRKGRFDPQVFFQQNKMWRRDLLAVGAVRTHKTSRHGGHLLTKEGGETAMTQQRPSHTHRIASLAPQVLHSMAAREERLLSPPRHEQILRSRIKVGIPFYTQKWVQAKCSYWLRLLFPLKALEAFS